MPRPKATKKKKKLGENTNDKKDCFVHLDDIARSTRKFSSLGFLLVFLQTNFAYATTASASDQMNSVMIKYIEVNYRLNCAGVLSWAKLDSSIKSRVIDNPKILCSHISR